MDKTQYLTIIKTLNQQYHLMIIEANNFSDVEDIASNYPGFQCVIQITIAS